MNYATEQPEKLPALACLSLVALGWIIHVGRIKVAQLLAGTAQTLPRQ